MFLKDIFKNAVPLVEETPTTIGKFGRIFEEIPLPIKKTFYCIVSFSCMHCINIIPKLTDIDFYDEFVLITDGEEHDNRILAQELEFDFQVVSYKNPLLQLGVVNTPTCVEVNSLGEVTREKYIETVDELIEFILASKEPKD